MNKKRTTTTVNGLPHLPMPCIGRHQRLPKWIMGLGQVTISIEWSLRAISDPIHKWIYAFCAMQQKNILFAKNAIDRAAKVALAALAAIQQHISSQSVHHSTMPGRSCASKIYIYIYRTHCYNCKHEYTVEKRRVHSRQVVLCVSLQVFCRSPFHIFIIAPVGHATKQASKQPNKTTTKNSHSWKRF